MHNTQKKTGTSLSFRAFLSLSRKHPPEFDRDGYKQRGKHIGDPEGLFPDKVHAHAEHQRTSHKGHFGYEQIADYRAEERGYERNAALIDKYRYSGKRGADTVGGGKNGYYNKVEQGFCNQH